MSKQEHRRSAWLGKIAKPVIVIVVGVAVVALLSLLPDDEEEAPKAKPPVVNVTVLEVTPVKQLLDSFVLKGSVEPWARISLSAETTGRIEKIVVREGDAITAGQPLVYLDDEVLTASAVQARAAAEFDAREVERLTAARGGGVATEMEVDSARSAAAGSLAAQQLAEAQLRQTVIRAPGSLHDAARDDDQVGRVNDIPVEIGEYLAPGQKVTEIIETRCVRVVVDVPELDIRYLKVGQETEVVIEALGDRKVAGQIHYIEPIANPSTRTFRTEVKVANDDGAILPGMFARVGMVRRVIENAIMIPFDAATPLESGYEVYVTRDGKAERRTVHFDTDIIVGKHILVRPSADGEGLHSGDMLIIQGQRLVGDDQDIALRTAPAKQLADLNATPAPKMAASSQPTAPTAPKEQ